MLLENVTRGPWHLWVDGGYLAAPRLADDRSWPLTTVDVRPGVLFDFSVESSRDSEVDAYLTDTATQRPLLVDSDALALAPPGKTGTLFTLYQRRATALSIKGGPPGARWTVVHDGVRKKLAVSRASGVEPALLTLVGGALNRTLFPVPPFWRRRLGDAASGAPAMFGGYRISSGRGPFLTCLDGLTGHVVWTFDGDPATSPVAVSWVTRTAVAAAGKKVHAVSLDTAKAVWSFEAATTITARPRAFADDVYVTTTGGVLHALSAHDGTQRWKFEAKGLHGTPAISGRTVVVGSTAGSVYGVDNRTGTQRWLHDAGSAVSEILTDESGIYFGTTSGKVFALNPESGQHRWTGAQSENATITARPVRHNGMVIAAAVGSMVEAYDEWTGERLWTGPTRSTQPVGLAVADDVLYETDGDMLWASEVTRTGMSRVLDGRRVGTPVSAPTVFSGSVHVNTYMGSGFAFPGKSTTALMSPLDMAVALIAATAAERVEKDQRPPLPPDWKVLGYWSGSAKFTSVVVARLRLPSDDREVGLVAFGTRPGAAPAAYNPATAKLVELPDTILGPGHVNRSKVTDHVLADYQSHRMTLLTMVPRDNAELLITGYGQGGALAVLAALDFRLAKRHDTDGIRDVTCVTFGAPPTGDAVFASVHRRVVLTSYRVVLPGDPVVNSLGKGWAHVGDQVTVGQHLPTGAVTDPLGRYRYALTGVV
ncbi:outer membrane protein assembly factor BamB [Saccharothrix variisporea]|uniref:Outer membrane protein assembly factor BamB n=2 Tax=Saccharothrix variisporea TaxID=543527 RepID=A0A495X5Q7_9PSEU|nr:outer membrane protein assembly factor BamB [Saccharothrix variisporea]